MTIVVSVKVTDGVVLASDSATTFMDQNGTAVKVYNNANKLFNLVKGLPLGAMTYGGGSIGTASIATLSKDLRQEFGRHDSPYYFDPENYSVEEVAQKCQSFFQTHFETAYPQGLPNSGTGYRVLGYGTADSLPQGWQFTVRDGPVTPPQQFYEESHYGPRWAGDGEALDRLVLGFSDSVLDGLVAEGLDPANIPVVQAAMMDRSYRTLFLAAMPIQDAIELARYLAETAAKFSHFSLLAPTIGGPIEIATITKHEGFKWVARKHYFNSSLNPGAQYA
ncbi:MAG: hypothetical protein EON54_23685 [Alcaligenaceae bacterium]|nr:MAG: hypothetical protein EON54_23685 [Alcaligenaceae bacterium]